MSLFVNLLELLKFIQRRFAGVITLLMSLSQHMYLKYMHDTNESVYMRALLIGRSIFL